MVVSIKEHTPTLSINCLSLFDDNSVHPDAVLGQCCAVASFKIQIHGFVVKPFTGKIPIMYIAIHVQEPIVDMMKTCYAAQFIPTPYQYHVVT